MLNKSNLFTRITYGLVYSFCIMAAFTYALGFDFSMNTVLFVGSSIFVLSFLFQHLIAQSLEKKILTVEKEQPVFVPFFANWGILSALGVVISAAAVSFALHADPYATFKMVNFGLLLSTSFFTVFSSIFIATVCVRYSSTRYGVTLF